MNEYLHSVGKQSFEIHLVSDIQLPDLLMETPQKYFVDYSGTLHVKGQISIEELQALSSTFPAVRQALNAAAEK